MQSLGSAVLLLGWGLVFLQLGGWSSGSQEYGGAQGPGELHPGCLREGRLSWLGLQEEEEASEQGPAVPPTFFGVSPPSLLPSSLPLRDRSSSSRSGSCAKEVVGIMIPEEIQRLLEDAEDYLADGLQNENLSAKAREQRDAILFDFQQVKARYHLEFLPRGEDQHDTDFGQDSSDENQSQSLAPSMTSDASLPSDFLDDGLEEIAPRPVQDTGNILKQGYLEKKSREHSFFGSEWQKRWCVLTRRTFYYYANEKSKQPKSTFSIENYNARLAFHLRKDSRKRCCFELICPGKRTYEFTAPSPAEAEDWVDQVQFLLKDLSSLTIPYDEEDEEELYNDVDSSDSVNTPSHNTTLNQDEPNIEMEDDDIYEVLPDEELEPPFPEDSKDARSRQRSGDPERDYANYYQGMWDCSSEHPDELSFHRGDLIYILSKEYNVYGWWVGELNNVVGIVPKDYLAAAYDLEE